MLYGHILKYIFNFLPLIDIIDNKILVNKEFYFKSKSRVKIKPNEVILLNNSFQRIKRYRKIMLKKRNNKRKRISSWKSKIRNPDDRIIF